MKGQKSPKVATQRWLFVCVFSPEAQFVCKVFLKKCIMFKWPHWGCSECTGRKTPNTVLYMEEKPRGEQSFWWVSTDWPWSEGNQEVSAAQHRDRKASGTISTYFGYGWVGGGSYLLSWTGNWGSLRDSDVQTLKRNPLQASLND